MDNIKAYDKEEQYLIDTVEAGLTQQVSEVEKRAVISAIQNNKSEAISIEISGSDLNEIKQKANRVGMSYQALINTVLHRYVSGDIVLKEQI